MATETKAICVWQDGDKWIVSLDVLDEGGGAITTRTLSVCDTREEAEADGRCEANKRNLPLYDNDGDGQPVLIQGVSQGVSDE